MSKSKSKSTNKSGVGVTLRYKRTTAGFGLGQRRQTATGPFRPITVEECTTAKGIIPTPTLTLTLTLALALALTLTRRARHQP